DGVMYRISTAGDFEVLRTFGPVDAALPYGELVLAGDGKLYGVSAIGGAGNGSIFRFDPDGSVFDVVYFFASLTGPHPPSGLLLGSDGQLYGSTPHGGANGYGTLFRIDTNATLEALYSFTQSDVISAYGVLAELGGSIYGAGHGEFDQGSLFRWNATNGFVKI